MKDYFSSHPRQYARYRPNYPEALFRYLGALVTKKDCAWDCGTGNGQMALGLARHFTHVYATDGSAAQLRKAVQRENISYSVQRAEQTDFPADSFDLIVVAQAIHWFHFEQFYETVRRTAKKHAKLAAVGYGLIRISPEIDALVTDFYSNIIGPYWAPERAYIDHGYQTIPFPFEEEETPKLENRHQWDLPHFLGYLNTWSAVKKYIKVQAKDPVVPLAEKLSAHWQKTDIKEVCFPLLLRVGKL